MFLPELFDELVQRDRGVGPQGEQRENLSDLRCGRCDVYAFVDDLQGSKQPDLQHWPSRWFASFVIRTA
ncbi:hypothetical protein JCM18897A_28810 [Streptomyces sp. JCM 18897]|uniref:Uncharacterized protein n=1 Tax=Streptomyces albidoflavus TaxID=1886 RepID=A0AA37BYK5_9ACTN|nr:hypothetical protein ScoT_34470 [Streptomyces albidoflavus]